MKTTIKPIGKISDLGKIDTRYSCVMVPGPNIIVPRARRLTVAKIKKLYSKPIDKKFYHKFPIGVLSVHPPIV
jgi:hypothetical protein